MTKTNLIDAEIKLLATVERKGLKRIVFHDRFEEIPLRLERTMVIARTTVHLVEPDESVKEFDEENALATGTAQCSYKDQFSKRKGRIIATARALKNLEG